MASPTYTDWPTATEIKAVVSAHNTTVGAAITDDIINRFRDAAVSELEKVTHIQFKKSTGQTRYYDGSGTGELEIDHYVTLTSVKILGYWGVGSSLTISSAVEVERNLFPKTRIYIYRTTLISNTTVLIDKFPMGRNNIEVVADFGYGATIPPDVFEAVCDRTAAKVLSAYIYNPIGMLTNWKEADVAEAYEIPVVSTYTMLNEGWRHVLKSYRYPTSKVVRRFARPVL